jgi:hypothetical protein
MLSRIYRNKMDWFTDIPKIFLAILVVIGGIIAIIFINSIDYGNPDKLDENLEKTTDFVIDNAVPTEINWISGVVDKVSNPWILLVLILGILWLFGYFLPKSR